MNFAAVAKVLLLDEDTIRIWRLLYEEEGLDSPVSFGYERSACRLDDEQQAKLITWITETLPRSTRAIGAWIAVECVIEYQSRSGLITLLHRLGMEQRCRLLQMILPPPLRSRQRPHLNPRPRRSRRKNRSSSPVKLKSDRCFLIGFPAIRGVLQQAIH